MLAKGPVGPCLAAFCSLSSVVISQALMVFYLTGLLSATDFCRHPAVEVLEQFLTEELRACSEASHLPVLYLLPKGFGYCLIH